MWVNIFKFFFLHIGDLSLSLTARILYLWTLPCLCVELLLPRFYRKKYQISLCRSSCREKILKKKKILKYTTLCRCRCEKPDLAGITDDAKVTLPQIRLIQLVRVGFTLGICRKRDVIMEQRNRCRVTYSNVKLLAYAYNFNAGTPFIKRTRYRVSVKKLIHILQYYKFSKLFQTKIAKFALLI